MTLVSIAIDAGFGKAAQRSVRFIGDLEVGFESFSQAAHEDYDLPRLARYFVKAVEPLLSRTLSSSEHPSLDALLPTIRLAIWQSVWLRLRRDPDLSPYETGILTYELYCIVAKHDAESVFCAVNAIAAEVLNEVPAGVDDVTDTASPLTASPMEHVPDHADRLVETDLCPDLYPFTPPPRTSSPVVIPNQPLSFFRRGDEEACSRLERRRDTLAASSGGLETELARINGRITRLKRRVAFAAQYDVKQKDPVAVLEPSPTAQ